MCPADYCSPAAADGTPTPETAPEEDGSTMPAPRDLAIAIMIRSESSSLPWSSRYLLFRNFARCFEISDAGWLDVRAAWRKGGGRKQRGQLDLAENVHQYRANSPPGGEKFGMSCPTFQVIYAILSRQINISAVVNDVDQMAFIRHRWVYVPSWIVQIVQLMTLKPIWHRSFDCMRHHVYTHLQDVEIKHLHYFTRDPFQRLLERVKISTPARIVLDNCCNRTKRRDAPHPARAGYRSLTRGQHP
ncbi:hypothetical protein GW17_00031177 [Ensete ventricosum]|nr:hypothetical protein GW17_00031177 [Ensete ventricosum]